jgi:enoyl-CoA hydratase
MSVTRTPERIGDVVAKLANGVLWVRINRPAARNTMSAGVLEGLATAIDIAEHNSVRVLVISGSGGCFCGGPDLDELAALRANPDEAEAFATRLATVLDRLESASFGTVAVVEGHAVAAGCELLLACDVAIAETTARIGDAHIEYGLTPAAGGSLRLSRYLSQQRARYLLLSGELLTGAEAERWGLVTFAVEPNRLSAVASTVIERIAGQGAHGIAAMKLLLTQTHMLPREQAGYLERQSFLRLLRNPLRTESEI